MPDAGVRDRQRHASAGVDAEAPLVRTGDPPRGVMRRVGGVVLDWLKTAALTLGTVYVVGWFIVTVGTSALVRYAGQPPRWSNTLERVLQYVPLRQYAVARDPTITADAAGVALEALAPAPRSMGPYTQRAIGRRADAPWREMSLAPELFPSARPNSYQGPRSDSILAAAARGFTRQEMAALRTIATAPGWKTFDLVARAPQVDITGGRIVLPFPENATWFAMPIVKFAATKEWAYAGVSRAAWHLAQGQRDSAEFALRAIVSFGFSLQDNATSVIEELIGAVITGIGSQGLQQYFEITGDPRGPVLARARKAAEHPAPPGAVNELYQNDRSKWRPALIRIADDPAIPRGVRFEALVNLQLSTCGDAREITFGPRRDVRDAFDRARAELARFRSERAVIDLTEGILEADIAQVDVGNQDATNAAKFIGAIYFNPRLPMCSLAALQRY